MNGGLDPQVHNPVTVEQAIRDVAARIEASVGINAGLFKAYQKAKRDLAQAKAKASLAYEGSIAAKKDYAELATIELREAMDAAYEKYKYGRELAKALGDELGALQSINKSVRDSYNSGRYR